MGEGWGGGGCEGLGEEEEESWEEVEDGHCWLVGLLFGGFGKRVGELYRIRGFGVGRFLEGQLMQV